jgi:hypothetical protein
MRLSLALATMMAMTSAAFTPAALTSAALTSVALAGEGFERVIPGRPGVPVLVNGIDISYAVVEGDFGLGKGVNNQPRVFGGRIVDLEPNVGHYYPSAGLTPGYGRLEIEPPANRKLPKPAESYHDSWSAHSSQQPAQSAQPEVPLYPPPVIVAPRGGGEGMPPSFR